MSTTTKERPVQVEAAMWPEDFSQDIGFRDRLRQVVDEIGSRKRAGLIANVKAEMITKYIDGKAKPTFFTVRALATAAGVGLDWLAYGEEHRPAAVQDGPVDHDLLAMVIENLEERLSQFDVNISTEKRARLIALMYEHFVHLEEEDRQRSTFLNRLLPV